MTNHRVFPRTYLNRIVFSINFERLSCECFPNIINFIKANFHLDLTQERLAAIDPNKKPLRFKSNDQAVEWLISSEDIRVIIKKNYISFEHTLLPIIIMMQEFMTIVMRPCKEIVLEKINILPVSLISYEELYENAATIFSETLLKDWQESYYQKDDYSLLHQTKENNENDCRLSIISGFISKEGLGNDQLSRYVLDISAQLEESIQPTEIAEKTLTMNDRIFNVFLNSITELVIKSMEEKE